MTRIVWVTNQASPYRLGMWRRIAVDHELDVVLLEAQQRSARDHDWHQVAGGEPYRFVSPPTVSIGRGEVRLYGIVGRAAELLRGASAVVLAGWESPAFWQLKWAAGRAGIPIVGFYESHAATARFKKPPIAALRATFFRSLDASIVPGAAAQEHVASFGVEAARIFTGFNAVDMASFLRPATTPPPDPSSLLYVGQLIHRKNVTTLLAAMVDLPAGVRLTVVGDGPVESHLRKRVRAMGLDARVDFVGYVPYRDLPGVMHRHAHLVLPSRQEVWGLVVNEALAAGMHVVVAETAGVTSSVRGMAGVYPTGVTTAALSKAVTSSIADWRGPITHPAVHVHTVTELGEVALAAIAAAIDVTPASSARRD